MLIWGRCHVRAPHTYEPKARLPGPDPRLGVHLQAGAPAAVLLGGGRQEPALGRQLLGHGPDVVRLEPAAAADVTDAGVVGAPRVPVHVPSGQHSGLQSCKKKKTLLYV